ncbi:MAG TPA: helix-turn-helix transcriptional regulator [Burkholderiaceae bacterium]|nr:helix-turn-helix transcriptional regulator [Burkholderiaceae bacterium]
MRYHLEPFAQALRDARLAQNLSQRELSKLSRVPQPHISKIERNQVDLRLSSFIALANALGLHVNLVPHRAMPAVQSIMRQMARGSAASSTPEQQPAYSLDDD